MSSTAPKNSSLPFWRTLGLLLGASRKRAIGRQKRQKELLNNRARKQTLNWSRFGILLPILLMTFLNAVAAYVVNSAVLAGERMEAERNGKIVVSDTFLDQVKKADAAASHARENQSINYYHEASNLSQEVGGTEKSIESSLRSSVVAHGSHDLVSERSITHNLSALPKAGVFPAMMGSLALLWWVVMIIFQGEGLELDFQRRRHPMWEWLFSHPVTPGAIFMAEMLSPIAANPIYWTAPIFVGFVYGLIYGGGLGVAAAILIGIPISIAAACLGKALEIGVILRFAPRSRGAIMGIMSWLGYASLMLFFIAGITIHTMALPVGRFLEPLAIIPWPWLGLFLGQWGGSFSFQVGMLICWAVTGITIIGAVYFSIWGAQQGLSGNFGHADSAPPSEKNHETRFGKEPLYRKELLWFIRDRSAIVQTILIPLTVAGYQVFNLRGVLSHAQGAWNYLCGVGILFGTYFLWVLGPKSLASEGTALWISLTWPKGLESLLKAKAWLWSMISTGIVALVLLYAVFIFPSDSWKILLVGISWFFFGQSMAQKSVTLVRVPSSSGEQEKIPMGRQWAASLGMMTFAIGVLTQQWHVAIMGIVYSYMTGAAMWQNLRARLPYLYDPWSERLPYPPTLMHAMIGISILVEGGAVISAIELGIYGRENFAIVLPIVYGLCAVIVSGALTHFLSVRGVSAHEIWCWQDTRDSKDRSNSVWCGDGARGRAFIFALVSGSVGGVLLGLLARGYIAGLLHFPSIAEIIHKAQVEMGNYPNLKISYTIVAVLLAPFAEEYLFRGLLFRALDREWGGWHAILGSAAFFAIYHPLISWLPVFLVGVSNALLFKKTGRLAPAVLLHMVYNSVVLWG